MGALTSIFPSKKDRRIGSTQGKRRYDLPLNKKVGTGFLVLLIGLMTFLGVMAMASSFVLNSVTNRWSSGLENRLSIEIPAEKSDGELRKKKDIEKLTSLVSKKLSVIEGVSSQETMSTKDVKDLISPWLGEDLITADIPLPGIISVKLTKTSPNIIREIIKATQDINNDINVDTHEGWLTNLLRLTGALEFSAFLIMVMISITTITAIAGAIRARMAIHHEDVELLHLMGASDTYISRQFQRHAFIMTLQGSIGGVISGAFVLFLISLISGDTAAALLPNFTFTTTHIVSISALPIAASMISVVTARYTVLRVLSKMP